MHQFVVLVLFFFFSCFIAYGTTWLSKRGGNIGRSSLRNCKAIICDSRGLHEGFFEEETVEEWLFDVHSKESAKSPALGEQLIVKIYSPQGIFLFRSEMLRKIDIPPFYLLKKPAQPFNMHSFE